MGFKGVFKGRGIGREGLLTFFGIARLGSRKKGFFPFFFFSMFHTHTGNLGDRELV